MRVGKVRRAQGLLTYFYGFLGVHNACMVENAKYGITAVRYAGAQIVEAVSYTHLTLPTILLV